MENKSVEHNVFSKVKSIFAHESSLAEVFDKMMEAVFEEFKVEKRIMPCSFLVLKDFNTNQYKVAAYPMICTKPEDMNFHCQVLKGLIADLKSKNKHEHLKMVALIRYGSAHLGLHIAADVLKPDGTLDPTKYTKPREDENSKDVLIFEMEEPFIKSTKIYEYITSNEDIVINETPLMDRKSGFDHRENLNSAFGFLFTEGQAMN